MTQIAVDLGAEIRDFDALQYHPNGGAWPSTMQGYSIPETTRAYGAGLLNAEGEEFTDSLGARDTVSQAIFDEVEAGRGVETEDGRPAVWLDTTRIRLEDAEISLPYMLRRYRGAGIDPPAPDPEPDPDRQVGGDRTNPGDQGRRGRLLLGRLNAALLGTALGNGLDMIAASGVRPVGMKQTIRYSPASTSDSAQRSA